MTPPTAASGSTGSTESESVAKGVEHLQAAAMEMISAARAFLDVVEDLVADPDKVAEMVSAVGTVATTVTDAVRKTNPPAQPSAGDGIQRIRVS
jgi:nicotinate-nucleotide pyrophosphorylase